MTSESSTRPSRVVRRLLLILGILAVVAAGLYGYGRYFGPTVSRVYFSPDKFAYKTVSHKLIPFLRIVASPPREREYKTPILEYVHRKGLVPPSERDGVRWHFAYEGYYGPEFSAGPAYELVGGFKASDKDILEWSRSHPEQARVLWPMIVELTREEEYWAAWRQIPWSVYGGSLPVDEYRKQLEHRRRAFTGRPDLPQKKQEE